MGLGSRMSRRAILAALSLCGRPLRSLAQTDPRGLLPAWLTFPLQTVRSQSETDGTSPPDELFTIFFVSDAEPRMRGNTDDEVRQYINNLVAYKTSRREFFDYDGGKYALDPKMVILGGDISNDRSTSIANDAALWRTLEENGIAFIAGFGNHDWTGQAQYTFNGDQWNREALAFCRDTYRNATRVAAPWFGYSEYNPTDDRGPVTSIATYRGVHIVNLNSFLYQPSYSYDFESEEGKKCAEENIAQGWNGCQKFASANSNILLLELALERKAGEPVIFVQHYPTTTSDSWWDDYGASGTTVAQKKERLYNMISKHVPKTALFTGHMHRYDVHQVGNPGSTATYTEYVAPYFGGDGGEDLNQGGGFLALLVSPRDGIVEVKHVPTPLYDPARTTRATTRAPPTPSPPATPEPVVDLSILGTATSSTAAQLCITQFCLAEAVQCSSDSQCAAFGAPLITLNQNGEADLKVLAGLLMTARTLSASNAVTRSLATCVDRNCGTGILTPAKTTTLPDVPVTSMSTANMTTTQNATGPLTTTSTSTTWNPWRSIDSGCQSHRFAVAALASTTAFLLLQ